MTVLEDDRYRNVTTCKCVMWLFKANIIWSKYAIEGMYLLTLTKCFLTRVWACDFPPLPTLPLGGNKEKLEQTCLMIWRWNIPLRAQMMITESWNNKTGNSNSKVFQYCFSPAPTLRIFTIFSHDWLHSLNISIHVIVDIQRRYKTAFHLCLFFHILGRNFP